VEARKQLSNHLEEDLQLLIEFENQEFEGHMCDPDNFDVYVYCPITVQNA